MNDGRCRKTTCHDLASSRRARKLSWKALGGMMLAHEWLQEAWSRSSPHWQKQGSCLIRKTLRWCEGARMQNVFVVLRCDHVTPRALCSAATCKPNAYRERHRPSEAIQANLPSSECVILRVHDAHNTAESDRQLEPEQSDWTVLMDKQGRS